MDDDDDKIEGAIIENVSIVPVYPLEYVINFVTVSPLKPLETQGNITQNAVVSTSSPQSSHFVCCLLYPQSFDG